MEYDGHSRMKSLLALDVAAITSDTTTDGNSIDTVDFESLEFTLFTGAFTDGAYDVQLEESDTGAFGGEENVVVADDLIGTPTQLAAANALTRIGYIGKKQFCRLSVVSASTTSGATLGAVATLGRPRTMPVADQ